MLPMILYKNIWLKIENRFMCVNWLYENTSSYYMDTMVRGLEKEKKNVLRCLDSKTEIDVPP